MKTGIHAEVLQLCKPRSQREPDVFPPKGNEMTKPEGVAAPLEPSQSAKFFMRDNFYETYRRVWRAHLDMLVPEVMAAYAAAVSKKAERERDAAVVTLRAMCGDNWQMMGRNFAESLEKIEARESRILELEKEIAALRETRK